MQKLLLPVGAGCKSEVLLRDLGERRRFLVRPQLQFPFNIIVNTRWMHVLVSEVRVPVT